MTILENYWASDARGTGARREPTTTQWSLRHALSNPIAGLLAELQLLEMHGLTPDQRGGVQRSIARERRLMVVVQEQVPSA